MTVVYKKNPNDLHQDLGKRVCASTKLKWF